MPLLIGGATTSRQHTAVKIAPEYQHATVHVLDASRAVGTVSSLLDPGEARGARRGESRRPGRLRELHADKRVRPVLPLAEARANAPKMTHVAPPAAVPRHAGRSRPTLEEIAEYIDWTFFFTAWELRGKFPEILEHPKQGKAARELFDAGKALLDRS